MAKVALRFGCAKQSKNLEWYLLNRPSNPDDVGTQWHRQRCLVEFPSRYFVKSRQFFPCSFPYFPWNWFILKHSRAHKVSKLGLTLWNLSCFEFKFDDTRLSYKHKNKIGRIEKNKIEGTPILKLAMVRRLKVKKNSEKSKFVPKILP